MKKFLLIFLVLFLTGCTAQYDLTINAENIVEDVTVSLPKEILERDMLTPYLSSNNNLVYPGSEFNDVYSTSLDEDNNNYYLSYNYTHDYDKFSQSLFLNRCYENVSVVNNDNQIVLSTSDTFMCLNMMDDGFYLDSADIRIQTDMEVVNNNADKVVGNTYIWNIDSDNYNNKSINIQIKKPVNVMEVVSDNETFYLMLFIVIAILVVALLVYVFVRSKAKRNNSF